MKSWRQSISSSLIIFILFLGGLHLSYGRHIGRTKTPMHSTAEFYEFWRRRFAEERMLTVVHSGDKKDLIYGVSGREAPAGPNPLHNRQNRFYVQKLSTIILLHIYITIFQSPVSQYLLLVFHYRIVTTVNEYLLRILFSRFFFTVLFYEQ